MFRDAAPPQPSPGRGGSRKFEWVAWDGERAGRRGRKPLVISRRKEGEDRLGTLLGRQ